ncbi:MAG: DUF4238 domain-containing protein [Pyrinomonadaceae bacterium]|nr:DUF4238 domain-containing protein [Pyrinomonadaceae bacterium]
MSSNFLIQKRLTIGASQTNTWRLGQRVSVLTNHPSYWKPDCLWNSLLVAVRLAHLGKHLIRKLRDGGDPTPHPPKFLLKGFASKVDEQEVFTWVYRKEGKVFEANTLNVSVEKHFYGKTGELNVDDEITDIEKRFARLLDALRNEDHTCATLDPNLPEFVGHLSSRTKHLRDSFIDSTEFLTSTLFTYLGDEKNFRTWILEYYRRHPEVVRKALDPKSAIDR